MKEKKTFIMYYDNAPIWNGLSKTQAGELIHILVNQTNPKKIEDPLIKFAYDILKERIDKDDEKWLERCEKNRIIAKNRWEEQKMKELEDKYKSMRTHTNAYERMQSLRIDTIYTDNDNDNDNDNEY